MLCMLSLILYLFYAYARERVRNAERVVDCTYELIVQEGMSKNFYVTRKRTTTFNFLVINNALHFFYSFNSQKVQGRLQCVCDGY
jgi:hypothetical protein